MTGKQVRMVSCCILILVLVLAAGCTGSQGTAPDQGSDHTRKTPGAAGPAPSRAVTSSAAAEAPVSQTGASGQAPVSPLLGRPTDHSVNVNVLPAENLDIFLQYWNSTSPALQKTAPVSAQAGIPQNIVISGLAGDTLYQYQACWHATGATVSCSPEYSFHTQREPGSSFVFAVQADSHLDERAVGTLYNQTLANECAGGPDFLIDMGDTFMTEKLADKSEASIRARYLLQRSYLGTAGSTVPLFLVLGNHDGESGYALTGKDKSLAPLSLMFRKMYFPNPEPDRFYTGNTENAASLGLKQDYYAWQWGDALFIVIDPYWYTTTKPGSNTDGWAWTLGTAQYDWLQKTLAEKNAKYTFVFSHHLVGGDPQGRGGTEFASLYEWGGRNADGTYGFDQHRPGWGEPIHEMLVRYNVTAFFHGHDHLFAYQQLDGVAYQEVPQPATMGSPNPGTEYGYVDGVILPSPGYLRIAVAPDSARVDYISTAIAGKNRAVAYSYTLAPSPTNTGG